MVAATLAKAAAAAEADRAAAEADSAAAEADRATLAATLAKEASDGEVARERLLLRHRQKSVQIRRQSLAGHITERSNIPEHAGAAQPMPNDRNDHVATEWGTPMRGEQKITSRNNQDQSFTAGQFGGGSRYSPRPRRTLPNQDRCATASRGCLTKWRLSI